MTLTYPIASNAAHPPRLSPAYKSTVKRSPQKPLTSCARPLSELTGPVYGHETVRENDADLTTQHTGEPLGERIIVHGHVRDEDGRRRAEYAARDLARPMPAAATSMWSISIQRHSIRILPARAPRTTATATTGSSRVNRRLSVGQPSQTPGGRPTSISRCRHAFISRL